MTIYEALVAEGCTIEAHESDLFVKASKKAEAIIRSHPHNAYRFVAADGTAWWDLPFAYDPFWEKKKT